MTELARSSLALAVAILVLCIPTFASAKVLQFNCSYQKFYDAEDNRLEDAKDFNFQFTVDTVTDKAVLIGNQGVEDVTFVSGDEGITFLEYLPTGAVQTTTVSKSGACVHSSHTLMAGQCTASQYYGSCR